MSKHSSPYRCFECSYQTIKWLGCCPECKTFNSLEQMQTYPAKIEAAQLTSLSTVEAKPFTRMLTGIKEWDRVMGGGIVPGAFMILTGDPGIGKSTLLLHVAYQLSQFYTVFYFSSEESLEQVKMRAERMHCVSPRILFSDQSDLDALIATCQDKKPAGGYHRFYTKLLYN